MTRVYLSLGSNIDREAHISAALDALDARFAPLDISPIYETAAVGFDGDPFLNLVVGLDTDWPVGQLADTLRAIETDNGRVRGETKFSARTLDIDILTYGDTVGTVDGLTLPREEITRYGFVLMPLADIAGDEVHPARGQTYRALWEAHPDYPGRATVFPLHWRRHDL